MATIPTTTGPRVQSAAGQIAAPPQPYMDAGIAGTAAGQGGAIGAGLREFGGDLRTAANDLASQALKEQALVNEAMARDADNDAATSMGNIYHEYASKEGKDAVAAKDDYMARMVAARKTAVDTMPNPEARRMLDSVLTRRAGFYQESIGRYAATEQKKWQSRSAQGAAQMSRDQAGIFRNVPDLVANNIESGAASVADLGEMHGWDKDTTAAEVAKFRGGAYQGVITQLLADGNTDGAAKMFDSVRDRIDAGSQAAIAQMLKPQLSKQRTRMNVAAAMGTGPGTATTIAGAIEAQESGGRDGLVSVDGARGRRQIMPGTFAQWAQPGESIDNPADNVRVSDRMLAAYSEQYGGDPERVAVAYFSGPGNVSEPGAPNPWKEDKKDGNGKSVSSYVRDISARLKRDTTAPPAYERPDFGAARERAVSMFGDDPEELTRVLAGIAQKETQYNSTTKVDRDNMTARLKNTTAALADGREGVDIPEMEIRRLYPKPQADEIIERLGEAQQQGVAMRAVSLASPQEFAAMLAQYDDVAPGGSGEPGPAYAQRAKSREMLLKAWQQSNETMKKDPAVYAGRAPAVAALASPEALAAPGGPEAYARATLGEQERKGLPEADRRVLPSAVTESLVQKVMDADPEKTPATLVMGQIAKDYGAMWPAVFRDMVRSGLPQGYAIMGSMSAHDQVGARGDAQRMMALVATKGGAKALREAVGDKAEAKTIDDGVDAALAPFYTTTQADTGGAGLRASMREFVQNMAYHYAGQGASGSKALRMAVDGVLNAKYDFDGTMRVPKGQLELAREVTRGVQSTLTAADLAPVSDGPIAAENRDSLERVAREGVWTPNADDTGLVLMGNYKVLATGIPVRMPVKRANGERVEVKFDDMEMLRNTQRSSGVPETVRREDASATQRAAQELERVRRGLPPQ